MFIRTLNSIDVFSLRFAYTTDIERRMSYNLYHFKMWTSHVIRWHGRTKYNHNRGCWFHYAVRYHFPYTVPVRTSTSKDLLRECLNIFARSSRSVLYDITRDSPAVCYILSDRPDIAFYFVVVLRRDKSKTKFRPYSFFFFFLNVACTASRIIYIYIYNYKLWWLTSIEMSTDGRDIRLSRVRSSMRVTKQVHRNACTLYVRMVSRVATSHIRGKERCW